MCGGNLTGEMLPLSTCAFPGLECAYIGRSVLEALHLEATPLSEYTPMFEEIAERLAKQCEDQPCANPVRMVRMKSNPPTGIEDGKIRTKTEWLADLWDLVERGTDSTVPFTRADFVVVCKEHYWRRTPTLTEKASGALQERNENPRARIRKFRAEAIEAYGGKCVKCGHDELVDLRLRLSPDQPEDYWAGLLVDGWEGKYEHLHAEDNPPGLCEVWCSRCEGAHPSTLRRTRNKISLRERVVAGYGGRCVGCETPADPRTVWVVRAPGSTPLTHEGGRKLNTRAKYETLVRMGFPEGFALVCPPCYARGVRK